MAQNVGNTPPDFNAPTGQFRLLASDTVATPLSTPVAGRGEYTLFSDDEIAGYLALYPNSLLRAVGTAYNALAGQAALRAKMVKDFDLQIDLTKRAGALADAAESFFKRADADDLLNGTNSTFGVTAAETDPSVGEVIGLPAEQWAWLEGTDAPFPYSAGLPPYLW
jgi:hypothetical protein